MEHWKDITGYEGRYQISDQGRVRSLPFKQRYILRTGAEAFRTTKLRIIAQQKINSGYFIVHLHLNNARKAVTVHSLVAQAFVSGIGEVVNHIAGDKSNNTSINLEFVTQSRNHVHAVELGLNTQAIRVRCPTTGVCFPSIAQAAKARKVSPRTATKWVRI